MNHVSEPLLQEAAAQTWPERNQRWLSQRFAWWCTRIEQRGTEAPVKNSPVPAASDGDGFEPAALRLGTVFGLSGFETELLVLAAGVEIDSALRDAVARVQGSAPAQPVRLSFSLALAMLPQPHWDALSPSGPLRHWSLVDFDTDAGFSRAQLRIDERVLHHLTGVMAFDERLRGLARFDEAPIDGGLPELTAQIARALGGLREPLVMLSNATQDAARKRVARSLACAVYEQLKLRTLWVDAAALATGFEGDARALADTARRIDREAALAGAGITLAVDPDAARSGTIARLISVMRSPLIVLGALSPLQLADVAARQPLRFNVPSPEPAPQGELSPLVRAAANRALQQFRVDPALLDQALGAVIGIDDQAVAETTLWDTLREAARGGLDALAQRIASRATFDDLVVPPFVAAQLREIATQLRHRERVYEEWGFGECHSRGLGIAALFAGESGTGKTLAAEAIANEARLDLYRIDLSSVVSKYIGETEKNLSRLFDAAERSGAVLLFDEADALFGKRSEVKDSHDRYANIEVAYLLQRIESYRGLAILTSNLKSALDRAFLRRIRFVVQFPFPDEAAREQIWRRQFPARAPLGRIDFSALARMQLSGGHIRSVALNAAFNAAGQDKPIGEAALMTAARAEFAKLERSFSPPMGGAA